MTSQAQPHRRLVILTEGHTNPVSAKTAASVVRYRPDEVVALYDTTESGKTAGELLGVGDAIPIIASLDDAPNADTLMIGIAPSGGQIPPAWRSIVLDAIGRGMDVVSGMHDFLCDDVEFSQAAERQGVKLVDVRKNDEHDVALREGIRDQCLRIQTVGNDCCVGKMVTSIEVANGLERRAVDAAFVATGQTGILIAGSGCPIDCVVSDFVSGAAEKLVLANQHHDVIVIEGQGSLAHPRYSAVTLGLLHGCLPDGLIMCYESCRSEVHAMEPIPLLSIQRLIPIYETMANVMHPCRVIGIAMNGRQLTDAEARDERARVRDELQLPVCDVFRDGPDELVDAVLDLRMKVIS